MRLAPALGIVFARAWFGEDDEVSLEPLPVRLRLRVLAAGLIPVLALPALVWSSSAISLAHLGGLPAAWLFLKLRGSGRRIHAPPQLPMRRPVMAPIRLEVEAATTSAAASPPATVGMRETPRATSDEVNRVLDKISALGMDSLTEDERRILNEYSRTQETDGRQNGLDGHEAGIRSRMPAFMLPVGPSVRPPVLLLTRRFLIVSRAHQSGPGISRHAFCRRS